MMSGMRTGILKMEEDILLVYGLEMK